MQRFLLLAPILLSCVGEAPKANSIDSGTSIPIDAAPAIDGEAQEFDAGMLDAAAPQPHLVYVAVGGETRLAVVELGVDGTLSARANLDLTLSGNPGALAFARDADRIYAGIQGGSIDTIALDAQGVPSLLGTTTGTGNPVYLSLARDESVLVAAFFGADQLKTFDLAGGPPHGETALLAVGEEPHAARLGPSGDRVYVPHRTGGTTQWFDVAAGGALTFVEELVADDGVGPRHIDFTPLGTHAYLVNEFDDSISAHTVAANGTLARIQTLPTIPGDFDGAMNTCPDVHVTPDGKYVYASNRGHDSIAMFSLAADGQMTALGTVPTETTPREFSVSPDGKFVVVAGQGTGFLQSYRVENDGKLTSINRLNVGPSLRWAIID